MGLNFRFPLVVAAALVAAGCTTTIPRHTHARIQAEPETQASAIFPSEQLVAMGSAPGWEAGRRDALFASTAPQTLFEFDSWQSAPAPDLRYVRRFTIPRTPETVTYFRRSQERSVQTYWGW